MTGIDAHHDELRRLTVLYWLGRSDPLAVESWIAAEFEYNAEPDPNLHRLFSHNDESERWLCHLAKSQLGFVPTSHAGVKVAQSILASYLQKLLNREI